MVVDARQCSKSRDSEDGCAAKLREAGQEPEFVEIMGAKIMPGRKPLPGFGRV